MVVYGRLSREGREEWLLWVMLGGGSSSVGRRAVSSDAAAGRFAEVRREKEKTAGMSESWASNAWRDEIRPAWLR